MQHLRVLRPHSHPEGPAEHAPSEHKCTCGHHSAAPEAPQGANPAMPYGPQPGPNPGMAFGPQPGMFPGAPQGAPQFAGMPYAPQPGYAPGMPYGPNPGMPYGPQPGMPYGPQFQPTGPAPQPEHEGCSGHSGPAAAPFGFPGFGAPAFAAMAGQYGEDPQHLQNQYGQMLHMCTELMQGKADPSKILSFLTASGTHFWKGALVGALLTFVLTNSSVKSALGETFSAIFGGDKPDSAA
ncbi:hypothetical protein [uncultured Desulfovibrio sp.]|uniref:hypothetical protein n=1 Tax=uncultured Desulfovibrio sp. TaxID=167968 RepID=UPI00266E9051|nr:hypothetical protein [uncultured Desulfovibrio sp.]